jgi:hypothetical protein
MFSRASTLGCMRRLAPLALLALSACGSNGAEFRPARGVKEPSSTDAAYRVKEVDPDCLSLGFIVHATSIDSIAVVAANHGGTHYVILDDRSSSSLETSYVGSTNFGVSTGHLSTYEARHRHMTAQVYRCAKADS